MLRSKGGLADASRPWSAGTFDFLANDYQAVMTRTERFNAFQGETNRFINAEAGHMKLHNEQRVARIVTIQLCTIDRWIKVRLSFWRASLVMMNG